MRLTILSSKTLPLTLGARSRAPMPRGVFCRTGGEDGSIGRLALCVLFNFAKVKFVGGVAAPAKFYLTCAAEDLWPGCARERHCGGKGVAPPCPTGIHRA